MDDFVDLLPKNDAETAPFDALLIDQDIDGASGAIAGGKLQYTDQAAEETVILLTNRGLPGEAAKRANPGIETVVAKLIRPSRLLAALTPQAETARNPDGSIGSPDEAGPRNRRGWISFWRKTTWSISRWRWPCCQRADIAWISRITESRP